MNGSAPAAPAQVPIFPEMGQAALRTHNEDAFAAWALVHAWDATSNAGAGLCDRSDAIALVQSGFGVGARQAHRLLHAGEGSYWRSIERQRLVLFGQVSVARSLGVSRVSRAHCIPVDQFRGRGQRRAALVALAYRTDAQDVPKTRRLVEELTGVPATTQRRLDREHGIAQLVSPVVAALGKQPTQWYADRVAQEFQDWGFFSGLGARLYRRHGNIRSATSHQIGSSAAVRRLNSALKEGRPAMYSRGPRAYFQGEKAVQTWVRDKGARGRSGSSAYSLHPLLNYSLVVGSPGPKRHHVSVLSEVRGASQLSGGSIHRRCGRGLP